jgi:Protein of unknown function (DUF3987)/Bifunctional DNA primase/polymerase, N-terminal
MTNTDFRLHLLEAGYHPLPLFGKIPPMTGWQKQTNTNAAEIAMWGKQWPDARNTGILTRFTPTLDIDITHVDAAKAVADLAAERFDSRGYVLTRTGKPPKCAIPFRTDAPFQKLEIALFGPDGAQHKIEFLCDGQQVVVAGDHPDTRRPYCWHGGTLGEVKHDDLPAITAEEARQLIDDAVDLLIRDFGFTRANGKGAASGKVRERNGLGFETGKVINGRERHMTEILCAKLIDYCGQFGAAPTPEELCEHAWIDYEKSTDFSRPGRGKDEFLAKCRSTVRRFLDGRIKDLETIEEAVAAYDLNCRAQKGAQAKIAAAPEDQQPTELFDPWQRYAVPAFPLEILSPTIKHFVMTQAEIVGCDRSAMAMAVLAALSGALDHRFALKIMRHGGWWASPRLWVLLVGDPSVKKTPIINSATDEIDRIQAARFRQYQNDKKEYVAAGGEPDKFRDPPDRYTAYDVTTEKLGIILAKQERGILIKRDELSGWIGSMEKYSANSRGSSADRAFWLKSFDGGPFTVDRVSRADLQIQNLSASIIGGIQPARLAELHGLTSDGLLQRFLPVMAGHSTFPVDRNMTGEAERYADLLRCLLGIAPQKLVLCDDAVALMEKLRRRLHDLEHASGGLADGFQGFVGKLAGIAGSLALILTITADPNRALGYQVATSVIEDITRLVFDFIIPHAFEFYRTADRAGGGDRLQRVASWILTSSKQRILPSDLTVNVSDLRGLGLWDLNQRISPLVAGGWLTSQEPGPIAKAWTVNPKVHELFSARSQEEEARKSTIAALMNSPRATKK